MAAPIAHVRFATSGASDVLLQCTAVVGRSQIYNTSSCDPRSPLTAILILSAVYALVNVTKYQRLEVAICGGFAPARFSGTYDHENDIFQTR